MGADGAGAARAGSEVPWSGLQRIAFRFAFVYLVVYSLPFPLSSLPGIGGPVSSAWGALWEPVGRWVGETVLGLEIVIQPTGSGDTAYQYSLVFCYLVLSAVAAAVWSAVDRTSDDHARLHAWLRVYVRYVLAATLLSYGAYKVIKSQFGDLRLDQLLTTWGDSSPMGLVWRFMGFSTPYTVFGGVMEMVPGFLLLFRRTTLAGALLAVAVMGNVVMLNYAYDVPVKLYSTHLLLMAVFLTLPDLGRLAGMFVLNRPVPRRPLGRLFSSTRARRVGVVVKAAFVAWLVWSPLKASWDVRTGFGDASPLPPLYGIWEVESQVVDGDTVPPLLTDSTRWRRLLVDRNVTHVHLMTGERPRYRMVADTAARGFTLSVAGDTATMAFAYGIDAAGLMTARTVRGEDSVVFVMRRRDPSDFLVNSRGFHWINELPFNR